MDPASSPEWRYEKIGPARVSFEKAMRSVPSVKGPGQVKPGDVVVLSAAGPGRGMEEVTRSVGAQFPQLREEIAVLDRCSLFGLFTGACVGHNRRKLLAGGP